MYARPCLQAINVGLRLKSSSFDYFYKLWKLQVVWHKGHWVSFAKQTIFARPSKLRCCVNSINGSRTQGVIMVK